ncbi:MAG TPA: metallophosphoesterase [Armatimonadota bacterium]|nr:metallophosphoesterase [Armatimonadota bacterium]
MKPWTFVHAADIQVGSPRSFRFAPAWNENWQTARKQIVEINPDLLLIGGDLTRDGSIHRYELEAIKTDLDSLPFPCHVIPGNMDTGNKHTNVSGTVQGADDTSLNLTSEQLRQFSSVFGPLWWGFVHKEVRFSGFCDMIAGSGLPEENDLWDWMETQRNEPHARHHVWIMHYPLFIDEPNEPNFDIRERYLDWYFGVDEPSRSRIMHIFKDTASDIVISGHIHCRRTTHVDGIRFDYAPATAFHQWADRWPDGDPTLGFLKYDVSEQGIECSFIPLEKVSTAKGYGPGGHPPPAQRDYSIAWEK